MQFDKNVLVSLQGSGYATHVTMLNHNLVADEPIDKGGNDIGPAPQELFLASLGTCTAITVKMYANRKKWDLHSVNISLNLAKTSEEGIEKTTIFQKINLKGNLSNEEQTRLMEIADKCPVHKMLESDIIITSEKI